MALSSPNALLDRSLYNFRSPKRNSLPLFRKQSSLGSYTSSTLCSAAAAAATTTTTTTNTAVLTTAQLSGSSRQRPEGVKLHSVLIKLTTSAIFFVGVGARACLAVSGKALPNVSVPTCQIVEEVRVGDDGHTVELNSVNVENHNTGTSDIVEDMEEDEELRAALESWKSKTYALTVPLRVVALRGSIPPSWTKSFLQSQGRRVKLQSEFRGSINEIFSDLFSSSSKGNLQPKSAMAADIVTFGDSWLSLGIKNGLIEPIHDAEQHDWFTGLSEKWKVYLRRNSSGELDSNGQIWAAPYRWGSMVIAYKKNKFKKHNMAPIEDWGDLWRPELAGKISMVDSPREVVGAVLKYVGASYNTVDIDANVPGGKKAALQNLILLQKQVRLFDSVQYLKAFAVGDVWVCVGWSSDIIPAAKRMSNVAVVVPKSGTSLWADLWAVPAVSKFGTSSIGGRARGPSPLIHQWIGFCLQAARALPFKQEVIPGAIPFALDTNLFNGDQELVKGRAKLDTNLIAGAPPPEILAKCEFLKPLTNAALEDYNWLIANMKKPGRSCINDAYQYISSVVSSFVSQSQSR